VKMWTREWSHKSVLARTVRLLSVVVQRFSRLCVVLLS